MPLKVRLAFCPATVVVTVASGPSIVMLSVGSGGTLHKRKAALPVPVWSSALLQLAEAQARGRCCGVITIDADALGAEHFRAVAADPATPVEGIAPASALHRTLLLDQPGLDPADAQVQVLAAAARLRARRPDIDTLVLECTNLPPYAPALRRATGLPVLDVVTLLNQRMASLPG